MTELLEKFVKLAPKEWRVRTFHEDLPHCELKDGDLGLMPEVHALLVRITDDQASAEAIVFLEGQLGTDYCMATISNAKGIVGYRYIWGPPGLTAGEARGKTRIEALVRACVAVWESQEASNDQREG